MQLEVCLVLDIPSDAGEGHCMQGKLHACGAEQAGTASITELAGLSQTAWQQPGDMFWRCGQVCSGARLLPSFWRLLVPSTARSQPA